MDGSSTNGATWHSKHPHLGTGPLPTKVFTCENQFQLEREHIFKKLWLNVGRIEKIPEPGNYFVQDIAMCQTSILVVRGKDGEIRAFHNMCSHRGNKIAWNKHGSCKAFTCKFHGWTYGLDGALRSVPDEKNFFELDTAKLGMTPVACDVWEGFIFINVDPNPSEDLASFLGEFGTRLNGYPFADISTSSASWTTEVNANWKVVKDAFLETYHVAFLHGRSLPDSFTSPSNPHNQILDLRLYPHHGMISLYGNADVKPSPVGSIAFRHGTSLVRQNFDPNAIPAGVNPGRHEDWTLDLNTVFPSFFIDISEGSYFTHNFWPVSVDRTVWHSTQYFPKAQTASQRFTQEYGHVLFRDIILEDGRTLEETHSMLASGAKKEFYVQDEEILVRHSHHVVQQMIENGSGTNAHV
ncbi:MAG: phenylpropionate dioxygenase-like ring-hydroxylating dioxygenase large terminal subunit [Gammaproteobacteria bacterium]|jgi:phenylpropionate dioxygenase-like ring-hydroxylating dioxygenase large terminal subunit